MKKLLLFGMLSMSLCFATVAQEREKKVKRTASIDQKVHNTFSRHKKHNGYKVKTERNGIEKVHKVNTHTGKVKDKKEK